MNPRFLFVLFSLCPAAAFADVEFCNSTDAVVSVAIGYKGDADWVSEGWWNVDPGDCRTVLPGNTPKSHYYYRVESGAYTFEHETYMFCTSDDVFTIVGDTNCESRGYDREGFNEIAMEGRPGFTIDITGDGGREGQPSAQTERDDDVPSLFDNLLDTSPSAEADPPGTHGEYGTYAGLFSHCGDYGSDRVCFFSTQGWVVGVAEAGPTPQALIDDLVSRPVNTAMQFSGDVMESGNGRALLALSDYMVIADDEFASDRDAMQGRWVGATNRDYEIEIYGSFFTESFTGEPEMSSFMHFRQGCPGAQGDGVGVRLMPSDENDPETCFFLSYIDDAQMELLFVDDFSEPVVMNRAP